MVYSHCESHAKQLRLNQHEWPLSSTLYWTGCKPSGEAIRHPELSHISVPLYYCLVSKEDGGRKREIQTEISTCWKFAALMNKPGKRMHSKWNLRLQQPWMWTRWKVNLAEAVDEFSQPIVVEFKQLHHKALTSAGFQGIREESYPGSVSTGVKFAGLWGRWVRVTGSARIALIISVAGRGRGGGPRKGEGRLCTSCTVIQITPFCVRAKKEKKKKENKAGKAV